MQLIQTEPDFYDMDNLNNVDYRFIYEHDEVITELFTYKTPEMVLEDC